MNLDKITVLITDDHPLARAGVRTILMRAADIEIVGEAENGSQAMEMVALLRPKVHLLDLKMPGVRAFEVEKWTRENYRDTATLILTAHDRDFYLSEMMELGVAGYLSKNERCEKLIEAIYRAAAGESLFTSEQYFRAYRWRETVGAKWDHLTQREKSIAQHLLHGHTDAEIADRFEIASRTVSCHVANLLKKLSVKSRQEATAWIRSNIPEIDEAYI